MFIFYQINNNIFILKKKGMQTMKKINKKKVFFVSIISLISLCLIFYFIFTYFSNPIQPRIVHKKHKNTSYPTVSFVAVGDNIIHENVYQYAYKQGNNETYNFKPCYQNIKEYISNYNLAYVNQETLIAGDQYGIHGYPNFNSPEALINDLEDTGFNMVSSATNHSMDLGKDALIASSRIWKQHSNILFSGLYENQEDRQTTKVIEKNGIRFSFLAYTFGVNESTNYKSIQRQLKTYPYILGQLDKEQIKEAVTKAKAESDVVIVAVHWGKEGHSEISDLQHEYANYFASLGVDVVIGNHPHLIQPIEKIDHTLVVYSLGNFLSTMKDAYNQLEGMISFNFVKKENEISIENIQYIPLINHFNDDIVTIYPLKDYTDQLCNQHSILKDQNDIINEFKKYVKQVINNKDIEVIL